MSGEMILMPYLYGRYSTVTGFAHIPPAVAGGHGFSWVLELRDFAEPDLPMQWPDPAPDVWCGPEAPEPLGPCAPSAWGCGYPTCRCDQCPNGMPDGWGHLGGPDCTYRQS